MVLFMTKHTISFQMLKASFIFSVFMLSMPVFAQAPDIGQMFSNFSSSSIQLIRLVSGASFLMGMILTFVSALAFKEYAESGGRTSFKKPVLIMLAGIFMIAFPQTINHATQTLSLGSNTGSILSDSGGGGSSGLAMMSSALQGVLLFVKLVGHIAVFRGILMLKKIAEGQQGAEPGRALTHIFGGAAAININATIDLLANSVGMTLPI